MFADAKIAGNLPIALTVNKSVKDIAVQSRVWMLLPKEKASRRSAKITSAIMTSVALPALA
jgi:hypothetical protein